MILRRITNAFRKQDWFTVVIETLIVVLGVFLGLQVNNWNQARLDRLETKSVLERLERDFELQHSYAMQQSETARKTIAANGRLIRGIRAGKLDEDTLLKDSMDCCYIPGPPGPSTTFQELVASGRMGLIRDDDLRTALYRYDSYVTLLRGAYPKLLEPISDLQKEMIKVMSVTATGEPVETFTQGGWVDSVDAAALLDDHPLYEAMQLSYLTQENIYVVLKNSVETMEHILALLKQAQGQEK